MALVTRLAPTQMTASLAASVTPRTQAIVAIAGAQLTVRELVKHALLCRLHHRQRQYARRHQDQVRPLSQSLQTPFCQMVVAVHGLVVT